MSLNEEKRNRLKKYILEAIWNRSSNLIENTSVNFGVSKQTVYNYIRELMKDEKVNRNENGNYELIQLVNRQFRYEFTNKKPDEDIVYRETLSKYVECFNDNTRKIWQYSFTEMVNNVLEHSESKEMIIYIGQNELCTWVNIIDTGVGIFKKIADYYQYETLDDAIISLFKGKLTTDKENHSGEGIFFTSRVMDHFGALSSNKLFEQKCRSENLRNIESIKYSKTIESYRDKAGTVIVMVLTNDTNRSIKEVFDMYSDVDGGFTTTSIPMKMICDSGYLVSRSQAKRLYFGFEKFEKVILDFSGVDEIGQGFAHELFKVFQKKHPEIKLECTNTNETIDKMIRHVTRDFIC